MSHGHVVLDETFSLLRFVMVMHISSPQQTQQAYTSHQSVLCIGNPEEVRVPRSTKNFTKNSTKLLQPPCPQKTTYESNYQNNVLQQYLHLLAGK